MKISEVRTRVVQWEGNTVPLPPHFCTNPMDLVSFRKASMGNFAFHNWLLVEIFTDAGLVGLGNAALSPLVTKQLIDTYLTPLLVGADPWDVEYLWQQMYRRTLAFGRKGVALTAISAVDIALWDLLGKDTKQPVFRLLGGRTKEKIPVYASRLYAMPLPELREEAQKYKDEGYTMMKLRFGWGPRENGIFFACTGIASTLVQFGLVRRAVTLLGERGAAFVGFACNAAAYMIFGVAPTASWLFAGVGLMALGSIANPAIRSMLSRAAPADQQGRMNGALSSIEGLTAIVAPLTGAAVFEAFSGVLPWRFPGAPFVMVAVMLAGAAMLVWSVKPVQAAPEIAPSPARN